MTRKSLQSSDYTGPSLQTVLTDRPVDENLLSKEEQAAILRLVGNLPAEYVKRLKPFELVMQIQSVIGQMRTVTAATDKEVAKDPTKLKQLVDVRRLGINAKVIISHLNVPVAPRTDEDPSAIS